MKLGVAVAPAATVTVAGTDASAGLELTRLNSRPPTGAGLASVILFEVTRAPPVTEVEDRMTEAPIGFTVKIAVAVYPFMLADTVTGVLDDTAAVVMVKLEETAAPGATLTAPGTDAIAELELESSTDHPLWGAGLLSVMVFDVSGLPPMTDD